MGERDEQEIERQKEERVKQLLENCNIDADLEKAELELNDKFGEM